MQGGGTFGFILRGIIFLLSAKKVAVVRLARRGEPHRGILSGRPGLMIGGKDDVFMNGIAILGV
jgi:hypothetical protein